MSKLNAILKEIEDNKVQAESDVQIGNPNTLRGRLGLKNASIEAIRRLKVDYRKELLSNAVFMVVTGSSKDSFTDIATANFGCFSSDPEELFNDIASRIDPSLYGHEGVKHLFYIATNVLQDKAMELDIESYPGLEFSDKYNSGVKTKEDFVQLIKNAITDQVGGELVGINAVSLIVDAALASKHSSSITPIVLKTDDEKFALTLQRDLKRLSSKSFLVVAGKASKTLAQNKETVLVKTVSESTVNDSLTSIKNTL